ncbi:glycosyltransferase [Pontibacter korlensis]|uniref:Spore protein YkvP/CgeB glycosyl transferase-like domain-containing protein n=1 Tax=Pontibacter korlensis TaxID=400092 RepID=A0A0E3ZBD1_9BACT|nr:glycosyltransferase [Pontibacter korlensis]AKD01934.1 hypothetical protein PKOR_00725 [Pontibacter korlensis]
MKIAIIGAKNFDSLEFHIKDELIHQGHQVQIFDYKQNFSRKVDYGLILISERYEKKLNIKLLERIVTYKPDLVIGVYKHIHPLVVKGVREKGIKIIHINPDQLTTLRNQQIFVEPYDAYFTKDPYMLNFMKSNIGLNVFQYQEAFNPRFHKKVEGGPLLEEEVNIDVLCFGTLYPYRNRMLKLLKEEGVKIKLFGRKAKYFDPILESDFLGKGVYGAEKAKFLNGSKIVFNNFHYAEVESVNNKFFEINGCGAFQICDYKPILNQLLPFDPKQVSFSNINEANALIKYYLNKPEKRVEIRDIIHDHFLENYTYKNMLNYILSNI